jgi:hypothetical protein
MDKKYAEEPEWWSHDPDWWPADDASRANESPMGTHWAAAGGIYALVVFCGICYVGRQSNYSILSPNECLTAA